MTESEYQRKFFKYLSNIDTHLKNLNESIKKLQPAKEEEDDDRDCCHICPNCESAFVRDYNFCPNCGHSMK